MPVYNFVCAVCGERFEQRLSFQDNTQQVACPNGHQMVKQVYSAPSVLYKGSGFYVTDHRKGQSKSTASE
jgi:putative FmdB family regulatory protein